MKAQIFKNKKMKTKKTKKIIITAKEWIDKVNGNSYFAARIELENETLFIPFTYGYGEAYLYEAIDLLIKGNYLPTTIQNFRALKNYCKDNNIVLYYDFHRNCFQRELKQLVINS